MFNNTAYAVRSAVRSSLGATYRLCASRQMSTIPTVKRRATFKELLGTPTFKTFILTVVFGSTVTELIARRKQTEKMREAHQLKVETLRDIIAKLQAGEVVDVQKEMRLLTHAEVDIDESIKEFLTMVEEPQKAVEQAKDVYQVPAKDEAVADEKVQTSKYL